MVINENELLMSYLIQTDKFKARIDMKRLCDINKLIIFLNFSIKII